MVLVFDRVICHIRPELEFLNANLSVLNFGNILRELPISKLTLINVQFSEPEIIELYASIYYIIHL